MLWTQHRDRWTVGGHTVRRIPYFAFRELTAGVTDEDMAVIGRLNAKREGGSTLTQEETDRLTSIAAKWPVDELRGACFCPPVSGEECQDILDRLPRVDSVRLEGILDICITPEIPQGDTADPLAVILVATGGLCIDPADMTVGQGYAVAAMMGGQ